MRCSFLRRMVEGICIVFCMGTAAIAHAESLEAMLNRYAEVMSSPDASSPPFVLDSMEGKGTVRATVHAFLPGISYQEFRNRLSDVTQWCEFVPLHLNVKACAYDLREQHAVLRFYLGPKGYTAPEDSRLLELSFRAVTEGDVLKIALSAPSGPLGSRNYHLVLRACEVDDGVYAEFNLTTEPGLISALVRIYLSTAGSDKVGFSSSGVNPATGMKRYARGQRGGAERNIVRYLFAVQAYFDTLDHTGGPDEYARRLERWFDLTEQYPRQLHEMPRERYLHIKMRERRNQLELVGSGRNH